MEPKFESNQAAFMPKKNAAQETELQKLNDELAKAEESFESMRRSMPLVPNSDYLGKMQAAASHIEQIKVKIGKLTTGERFHFQVHNFPVGTANQLFGCHLFSDVLQHAYHKRYYHQRGKERIVCKNAAEAHKAGTVYRRCSPTVGRRQAQYQPNLTQRIQERCFEAGV